MNQNEMVVNYMETRGLITPLDAKDEMGIMRLAARVDDIKNGRGVSRRYRVHARHVTVKNKRGQDCRVKGYWLEKEPAVHFIARIDGFMAVAPCGFDGVATSRFTQDAEKVTCWACINAGVNHG